MLSVVYISNCVYLYLVPLWLNCLGNLLPYVHALFVTTRVELKGKIIANSEISQRLPSMVQSLIRVTISMIRAKSSLN